MSPYSISIIVPVYNEVELLRESLQKVHHFLGHHFPDFEILIIESGSSDGSAQVSDVLSEEFKEVVVIHEEGKNGFGSALRLGYARASKDLVWLVTVDLPFPLEAIREALPHFENHDAVLSYRSKDPRGLSKKFRSLGYNLLVKWRMKLKVKHVNSAFKVYKREIIQALEIQSNGWFIDAEIIFRLQEKGVPFIEIPVELIDRSVAESSVGWSAPVGIVKEMTLFLKENEKKG